MQDLAGKVAVVTGGGSGIGRGMALAFAEAGMRVVVADVDTDAGGRVRKELAAGGAEARAIATDVSSLDSVEELARRVYDEFGATHLLCNNAGVSAFGPMDALSDAEWNWVISVNLFGVIHGLRAFLPRMKAQPGPKHVVNTASIAGMVPLPGLGSYTASKYAVVGLSEALRLEGAAWGLGCSVLCPGNVNTGIVGSARNRPAEYGGPSPEVNPLVQAAIAQGMDPEIVGRIVRQAVIDDAPYIFTHLEQRAAFDARVAAMVGCFDQVATRD